MPEETSRVSSDPEAAEPDLDELRKAVQGARKRLRQLAASEVLTPQAIALEISGTVLPLLGESIDFIDRLEEHAEYVSEKIEAMEGEASQLLPEDAERFVAYIHTVNGVCERSLADLDPSSDAASGLEKLKAAGASLLERIEEIEIEDDDDDEAEAEPS